MRKSLSHIIPFILVCTIAGAAFAAPPAETTSASAGVININTADASQFALLPRVGKKAAERIVEYRKANGGFKKTTDLMQVKGIGDKTFELLTSYLVVEGKTTLVTKQHGPKRPRSSKASKARPESSAQAQ